MTLTKKDFNINPILLTNIVFAFFPISFIFGNLITNLNTILFCCLGIFHLRTRILKAKFNIPIKLIFLLFFLIFFSTSLSFSKSLYIDGYDHENLIRLIKSIAFFRYFLILIVVYLLSEFDILNFKYFFVVAAFASIFVSLDVIFQYIFGFNVIGLKSVVTPYSFRNSSFFGSELIAGGFIKNFSFFSIFFIAFKLKNKRNIGFALTTAAICIVGTGVFLSGDRMPLILFIFGLLLIFLLKIKIKKILSASLIGLFIIFGLTGIFDERIEYSYTTYYKSAKHIISKVVNISESEKSKMVEYKDNNSIEHDFDSFWVSAGNIVAAQHGHVKLYYTAIDTWKQNKIFGNGIKSFRIDCTKFLLHTKNRMCSNHPHNYYLEILTDTGIVGLILVLLLGLIFIFFIFKNFRLSNVNNMGNSFLLAAIISLILETFPIKSTGSVFTTNDATYLILISSIILSYKKLLSDKYFDKQI